MASGEEWRKYFERQNVLYLKRQVKEMNRIILFLDKKIVTEFQLNYLGWVRDIARRVIEEKESVKSRSYSKNLARRLKK